MTLAWIFSFFFLPVIGFVLYVLLGYRNLKLRKRRLPKTLRSRIDRPHGEIHEIPLWPRPRFRDVDLERLSLLCEKLTGFPSVGSNRVAIHEDAAQSYQAMLQAIAAARDHIHLEFYIFQPDETGTQIRDALTAKARDGIRCRVLLDSIGSFGLSQAFLAPMREAGIQIHFFGHGGITRPWGFQLRNHRKLLIIDGWYGFTGSQNIGNEYNRGRPGKLSWRDTQVQFEGPAVQQLQQVFAEDWQFTTGESLHTARYFPTNPPSNRSGESIIQTLPTGPDEKPDTLEMILIHLIHQATQRVTIVTPYFVPSVPLVLALESAAKRGVRVDLVIPKRSDSWIVDRVSRSWFSELLSEGIHIYEYAKTFVHAKVITIDDRLCLLGSANMDERSFKLNFECSLIIYDNGVTLQLLESFDAMKQRSRPMLTVRFRRETFIHRVSDGLFRVLSPLL